MSAPTQETVTVSLLDEVENLERSAIVLIVQGGRSWRGTVAQALALVSAEDLAGKIAAGAVSLEVDGLAADDVSAGLAELGERLGLGGLVEELAQAATLADAREALGIVPAAHYVGEVFELWDHLPGVVAPANDGIARYVRLTAGQSGAGGYNAGLITGEVVSGTAPAIQATAQIAFGPLTGQSIRLINTEQAFLRPRAGQSGTRQTDALQGHWHLLGDGAGNSQTFGTGTGGTSNTAGSNTPADKRTVTRAMQLTEDGTSGTPRTASETRPTNVGVTAYMRIA